MVLPPDAGWSVRVAASLRGQIELVPDDLPRSSGSQAVPA